MKLSRLKLFLFISFLVLIQIEINAQVFKEPHLINELGMGYNQVRALDANNDGALDILCFPYLYFNDGKGKVAKKVLLNSPVKPYLKIQIKDLDQDTDIDFVVLYEDGSIAPFYNNNGEFTLEIQLQKTMFKSASYPELKLMDVNSDGLCDIVIECLLGPSTSAYIANQAKQFTYFKPYSTFFNARTSLMDLDIDQDGITELMVTNSNQKNNSNYHLHYHFKNNEYSVKDSILFASPCIYLPKYTDVDKDGDLDLVYLSGTYNGNIYWSERDSKGGFGSFHLLIKEIELVDYQIADFDFDGDLDILYGSARNQFIDSHWLLNQGNNNFIASKRSLLPMITSSNFCMFQDFNGDKINDIVFYDDDNEQKRKCLNISLLNKLKVQQAQHTWITAGICESFVFVDINKNKTKDLIGFYHHEIFYKLLDSLTYDTVFKTLAMCPFKMDYMLTEDMDLDGKVDLLCINEDENGAIAWLKNTGSLPLKSWNTVANKLPGRMMNVCLYDIDNDGKKEIIFRYVDKALVKLAYFKNLGQGKFEPQMKFIDEKANFRSLYVVDVNQDGKQDLIDFGSKSWYTYIKNGTWTKSALPFNGSFIKDMLAAKIDQDEFKEYLFYGSQGLTKTEYNGTSWKDTLLLKGITVENLCIGDINKDGLDDLVAYVSTYEMASESFGGEIGFSNKYHLELYMNEGNGKFNKQMLGKPQEISDLALYDIDQDGDLDLITSSYRWPNDGISVWENRGGEQ